MAYVLLSAMQIFLSADGGYTFQHLFSFSSGQTVTEFVFRNDIFAFLTSDGRVFYGRAGSSRIVQLESILLPPNATKLVFDSRGLLNTLIPSNEVATTAIFLYRQS